MNDRIPKIQFLYLLKFKILINKSLIKIINSKMAMSKVMMIDL